MVLASVKKVHYTNKKLIVEWSDCIVHFLPCLFTIISIMYLLSKSLSKFYAIAINEIECSKKICLTSHDAKEILNYSNYVLYIEK